MGAGGAESVEAMITKLEQLKGLIDQVHNQIRNPEKTTFVCVCIPEFLSIYETERLVQELSKSEIDTHNVVVNQVLFPDKDAEDLVEWYAGAKATLPQEAQDLIGKTISRKRMQDRYISQIFELYEDFHITLMPLLDNEVTYCDCFFNIKYSLMPYTHQFLKVLSIRSHADYLSLDIICTDPLIMSI
jgi:arsenite/tail-anchored protein-transporting ATPase